MEILTIQKTQEQEEADEFISSSLREKWLTEWCINWVDSLCIITALGISGHKQTYSAPM